MCVRGVVQCCFYLPLTRISYNIFNQQHIYMAMCINIYTAIYAFGFHKVTS